MFYKDRLERVRMRIRRYFSLLLCIILFISCIPIQTEAAVIQDDDVYQAFQLQEETGDLFVIDLYDNLKTKTETIFEDQEYTIKISPTGDLEFESGCRFKYYLDEYKEEVSEPSQDAEVISDFTEKNEIIYKFQNDGKYRLFVEIKDSSDAKMFLDKIIEVQKQDSDDTKIEEKEPQGIQSISESDSGTIENNVDKGVDAGSMEVKQGPQIDSFRILPGKTCNVGDHVQLEVTGSGKTENYQYEFYVIRNGVEIKLCSYSADNTYIWNPITPAEYTVGVRVKDREGNIANSKIEGVQIKSTLSIADFNANPRERAEVGNSVTLSAQAEKGSGGYQYQFYVLRDGKEIPLTVYSARNSYVWIPMTPANYVVCVRVKDSAGTVVKREIKSYVVESTLNVKKFDVSPSSQAKVGEKISIEATAERGTGSYQYQFYVIRDGQEIPFGNYSNRNTYDWTPITPSTYTVGVRVKDSAGTIVKSETNNYKVESTLSIKQFQVNPENTVNVGESVSISAKAEKGSGNYQYQFYVIRDGQEIPFGNFSKSDTYNWTPITPATYTVGVRVKDSAGTIAKSELYNYKVQSTLRIRQFQVDPGDGTKIGESVSISAFAEKGSGSYQYQFYVIRNGQEIPFGNYSKSNTYNWTPITPATYTVGVRVKDSAGVIVKKEIQNYVVEQTLAIKSFLVDPESAVKAGGQVSLKASAEKGSGSYQYQFYVVRDGQEIILKDFSSQDSYTWNPVTPATYTVGVRVKDSIGTVAKKEIADYKVTGDIVEISSFYSSNGSTIKVGESTILRAEAIKGVTPYQYSFYVIRNGEKILLQDYSEKNYYTWSPFTPAEYQVYVSVKDALGRTDSAKISANVIKSEMKISEYNVGNNLNAFSGESVLISVKVNGGMGELQYRYYVMRDGAEIQLSDWRSESTFIWNPITSASYKVCVDIKDSIGNSITASKDFVINQNGFKDFEFSMNKTDKAYVGTPISLSAKVSGGSGDYSYRFYVIRNEEIIVLKDYSTADSYTWTPITPAKYSVCVDVKDKKTNIVATKILSIEIESFINQGIDVSSWQGLIDWSKVKDAGIDFAMIRILSGTMSTMSVDGQFYNNINGAKRNGIKVGVYRYGYATSVAQAREEANMVVETLKSSGYTLEYPIAYDVEDVATQGTLTKTELTAVIKAFQEVVENNGYKFMIYANLDWLKNKIEMSQFKDEDVWIARYRDYTPNLGHGYTGDGNVTIWQYSDRGAVPGIKGNVDMNISYKMY